MKKKLSILLAAAMLLTALAGCGTKANDSSSGSGSTSSSGAASPADPTGSDDRTQVNFTVLSGPTGVGAAMLLGENENGITLNDYNVTVAAANDEVTAALINGDTDIAAIATNVASTLSAKSNGSIQVLAVNTLGVLYILEKGDTVQSLADLRGKTIYATGQGANPEFVLNYLLTKNDVDPADVDIQWMTAQAVSAKMISSEQAICMLPVPAATGLMVKDSAIRQAVSLSEAWNALGGGVLPMGCVVARTEFVEANPQAAESFLLEYGTSISYMSDLANLEDAAQLVAQYGITANAEIAAAAIPQCSLTFLVADEMKDALQEYYQVLFQADPAAIGGAMPYDSFYYGAP